MDLFFSKTLGGDYDSACVAYHHPSLGGGDNLSLPIGVEADDKAGNNLVQAQARFPVTSNEEMKGFNYSTLNNQGIRDLLAERLNVDEDDANWLAKFRTALNSPDGEAIDLITEQNVSMLIAEYERSQTLVNTPWKKYIEGDKQAISLNAKKGAILFYTSSAEGGADCSSCHQGDFFTDESFHNIAMP